MTVLLPRTVRAAIFTAAASALMTGCGSDGLTLPDQTEPAAIEVISGTNQAGSVGSMLAEPLVVRVTDLQGRPVAERKVAFVVTGSDGDVAPDTAMTDADGRATARWVLGRTQGMQHVEARVVSGTPLVAPFVASANVGQAARVVLLRGDGQVAVAGSALAESLVVRTLDAASNPVAGITVTWSVTGGGSVSAPTTVSGTDGTTGVRRTLGPQVGTQATAATVSGAAGSPITFTSTATVGTAGKLRIEVQPPATAQSGAPLSRQPQIQLIDDNANPVIRAGVAVTATIASGPAGATLIGATASTNANGLAAFTELAVSGGGGTYAIAFSSPNVVGVTSTPIAVAAGSASALRITTQPSATATTGVAFATQPVVQLVDAAGNAVAKAGTPVTAGISSGGGTLGGTLTVTTDAGGVGRFTDLTITTATPGVRTLIFASAGLASVTSSGVDVRTGPSAANSSITVPASLVAGVNGTVTVTVRDGANNPVSGTSVTLSATGTGNTITQPTATTNASGVATFTFRSTVAEAKNLSATFGQLTIGPTSLTVVPAAAAASQTTATVPEGRRFRETSIIVQAFDQFGNMVKTGGATVTGGVVDGPNDNFALFTEDRGDGTYELTYTPLLTGDDKIEIRLGGAQIKGSPFTSKVRN